MKMILVILAVLLVLAHPVAVALVLGTEAAVVAGCAWLAWQGLRGALYWPGRRRRA